MKRMIAILLVGAFLLAGCQAKGEPLEAAQKNTEQIIEAAAISNEQSDSTAADARPLAERIAAPTQLQWNFTSEDNTCAIHIDAPVIVPDADMPIVRVRPAQFTQTQVTKAFQVFCGDTPMYHVTNVMTKAEIADFIALRREQLKTEDQPADREFYEQHIAELEEAYQTAPETKERVLSDGTLLPQQTEMGGVAYMGVEAESLHHELVFQARNDYENTETITSRIYDESGDEVGSNVLGITRSARISCIDYRATFDGALFGEVHNRVYRGDRIPEEAQPYIDITPDEAYDIAQKWLDDFGISDTFVIADVFLDETSKDFEEASPVPEYYYGVFCTRLVSGIPCAYLYNYYESQSGTRDPGGSYQAWAYERVDITVTKDGLARASWTAPLEIGETVSARTTLKPFAEIEEIAKKALPIIYEKRTLPEWVTSTSVEIDRVALSLQRIVDQTQFDSGLLIPVWNFYGTWTDSRIHEQYNAQSGTMLSINAIDGSIIDVEQGY